MQRREFLKSLGLAGGAMTGLTTAGGGLRIRSAQASDDVASRAPAASASRKAMEALLETIREVESTMLTPERGFSDAAELAEAERALAHILQTGLEFWLEADPDRPAFRPYVTPTRKLLGCNPDSVYYFAPIRDDRSYRIRGNVGAAVFTSFTIERGSHEGHAARGSIAAISDMDMQIDRNGNYEILVSRTKPGKGDWLPLSDGASQITTRHYHEARQSVAALPGPVVRVEIDALDPDPLGPWGGDAESAAHLEWVRNFVREHSAMTFRKTTPEMAKRLGWVSLVPNRFGDPGQWKSASGEIAYGNDHAWYNSAYYELEPDEALIMSGRFPECRFANVVLWNSFMQSYDYAHRQISLNREQIEYEEDGSFRIVIAHEDPGIPNWLDTEGRRRGNVYWRYVFPVSPPERPNAEVVKLSKIPGR
ncbi:MAG TPA: DUF1214 domain-containing protein [Deltaproteobacteria bacterium]|nr:DUF1214 domain-containing protein [Deltaproteobacteria bacterium]